MAAICRSAGMGPSARNKVSIPMDEAVETARVAALQYPAISAGSVSGPVRHLGRIPRYQPQGDLPANLSVIRRSAGMGALEAAEVRSRMEGAGKAGRLAS